MFPSRISRPFRNDGERQAFVWDSLISSICTFAQRPQPRFRHLHGAAPHLEASAVLASHRARFRFGRLLSIWHR